MPECVLIVEDDALLAMSLEQILEDAGVSHIESCATIKQAIIFLRDKRPDAVVLDVHLADGDDGYAIAELVAALKPNLPKIVFSTGSPADIPASAAKLGPILEKPYAPDELLRAIAVKPKGIIRRFLGKNG